jgi:chemotaxis protein CheX
MKVELINPIISSLVSVLSQMGQIAAKPEKPILKKGAKSGYEAIISGYIGLVGEKIRGSMAISFTEPLILKIASNLFGEEMEEVNDEVADLVGEITNIITGNAKPGLAQAGYKLDLSIPTIIIGLGHYVIHNTKGPVIIIPFSTESGSLLLEVCFK